MLDVIYHADARDMRDVPSASVRLVLTSPPYNVGEDYDTHDDAMEWRAYLKLLRAVWRECDRVLVDGGRIAIVVANTGRKPYRDVRGALTRLVERMGFLNRGEVIWHKGASAGSSTAWGSWRSASNPTLRDVHEYILLFSKGRYELPTARGQTIGRDEFMQATLSVWEIPTERGKEIRVNGRAVKHPCPFPFALARRVIELYTSAGDTVLDPFCGSGTTALAALETGRHFVGYDISADYVALARRRIETARLERQTSFDLAALNFTAR